MTSVAVWLAEFHKARGRSAPTGDPLYRYRMTDGEFESGQGLLGRLHAAGRLENPDGEAGALFVAFGAEWFRRHGTTLQVWNNLAPDILANVTWQAKAALTDAGLTYWRRPLRRTDAGRQFLLTLALEGGFPVLVLREGGRGWLRTYLATVTGRSAALADVTDDVLLAIAREESGLLSASYRQDDFIALCAELVGSVLVWRRVASSEAAGLDPVAYLDARHAGWRDEIPLYLPAGDRGIATDLLNGLVRALPSHLIGDGVDCIRLLVHTDGAWRPAVRIGAAGEIAAAGFPFAPADGRIRARPAGALAAIFGDAIAVLDPPGDGTNTWLVRPSARLDRPIVDVPFEAEIAVDLVAAGGLAHRFRWPRGEPVRSRLLVFAAIGDALRLVGRGSARTAHQTVRVLAPSDWSVRPPKDTAADAIGASEPIPGLGACLHTITGAAWFGSDTEEEWYLVRPGSDPDEGRLAVEGTAVGTVESGDPRIDLCKVPVRIAIARNQHQRLPQAKEVVWRHRRGPWRDARSAAIIPGIAEIVWNEEPKDEGRSIRRDRVRVAVLPEGAVLSGRMTGSVHATCIVGGLPGWNVQPLAMADRTVLRSGDGFAITFTGRPAYSQPFMLADPHGEQLLVSVRLPGLAAAIVRGDGKLLRPADRLTMTDLRGMVAVSPTPERLTLALGGIDTLPSAHISVRIDGEQPLGVLRTPAEGLLAATANLDACIDITLAGEAHAFRLTRFAHGELTESDGRVVTQEQIGDLTAVLKILDDPEKEIFLHREQGEARCWALPEVPSSALAYLRRGGDVVSRPHLIVGPELPPHPQSALRSAGRIADGSRRKHALRSALFAMADATEAPAQEERRWLLGAIGGLRGLPATSLDVLKALPAVPEALAHLLMFAGRDETLGQVHALQNELPFLWSALTVEAWQLAGRKRFDAIFDVLVGALPAEAGGLAATDLRSHVDAITRLEPALAASLARAGLPSQPAPAANLRELAQEHVKRADHRDVDGRADAIRYFQRLAAVGIGPPPALAAFDLPSHPGLLAPCLLAASAAGRLRLDREDLFALRRAIGADPDYTTAAFTQILPAL